MIEELSFFLTGAFFGILAGVIPGPLIVVIISETIRHDHIEGIKVALAPFITDLFFIPATLLLIISLKSYGFVFGILSLLGAAFLLYLAYENFTTKGLDLKSKRAGLNPFHKGIITDLLDPIPYFFWFGVAGPILLSALEVSLAAGAAFIVGIELFAILSTGGLAVITHHSKNFFKSGTYLIVLKVLGVVLLYFAWMLFTEGLALLGI